MLKVRCQKMGKVTIIHLHGRIVTGELDVLRNAVLSQADLDLVALDFARVTAVDARGLGVMLELREWALSLGIDFFLINISRLVRDVLENTRLNTVFKFSSQAEILSAHRSVAW